MNILPDSFTNINGLLILLIGILILPATSMAQHNSPIKMSSDVESEVVSRFTEANSVRIITNKDKSVNLVVAGQGIAIQFTDQFLENLEQEIRKEESETENSTLANVITSMVGSGVRTLLDHAIVIPYHEISGISLDNGKIVILDFDGKEIFNELEINDKQVMEDFSRRDARRFVADVERELI